VATHNARRPFIEAGYEPNGVKKGLGVRQQGVDVPVGSDYMGVPRLLWGIV
jgi:hypothetical protein